MGLRCHLAPASPTPLSWRAVVGAVLPAVLLLSSGCAKSSHDQLVAFLREHEADVATGSYVVQPPDVISIHAPAAPEIDGVSQRIRSDGKIAVRLVGEVDVAGLTPEQIAAKLQAQLSRYYVDPDVMVQVRDYRSQVFYVFGEVAAPGPKPYTGRDTLLSALASAQPTFLAWRSQIRVTRPSVEEGERKTVVVDLDRMLRTGDTTENILIQEGDIIEVPPTPLAWVGLRVRELLYPVQPVLDAYGKPAEFIDESETYDDHFSGEDEERGRRSFLR